MPYILMSLGESFVKFDPPYGSGRVFSASLCYESAIAQEERSMQKEHRASLFRRLSRLVYLRLIIPLRRSSHPPEYTARGVAVAVFWAFTPLIPIQSYLLGLTWLIARRFPQTEFNLLVSLAWIWVTNAFTMIPIYFVFYVSGQFLLGQWDGFVGYAAFAEQWRSIIDHSDGFLELSKAVVQLLFRQQGIFLAIGCLPYAFGLSWLSYIWSCRTLRKSPRHTCRRATN